jgi:uncharacterized repeat protein (TIGR02543 family)
LYRLRTFSPLITILLVMVFILSGCLQKTPPQPKTIITGKVETVVDDTKAIAGQALADATVSVINPLTGQVVASGTTDQNGQFSIEVPAGGPYIVQAAKGNIKIMKVVTPAIQEGETRDIDLCDSTSTALALIFQELVRRGYSPSNIDLNAYTNNRYFPDLVNSVNNALLNGNDPTTNQPVNQNVLLVLDGSSGGGGGTGPTSPPVPPPQKYTVTYDTNGGSEAPVDPNSPYYAGETVTVLSDIPTKLNHDFAGWLYNGTVYQGGQTFQMPQENVTLVAQWTEHSKYTVTYDTNGGENPPIDDNEYYVGQAVTVKGKESMTRSYYVFSHWSTTSSGSGTSYNPGDTFNMPSGGITLYARWVAKAVDSISIKTQPRLNYTTGDKLDLSGMVVTLTYNDGSPEDVGFADFGSKGITTDPAHDTELKRSVHNDQPVTVSCNNKTAETDPLSVSRKSIDSVTITGDAAVGKTLTANPAPTGATVTYQWQRSSRGGTYSNIDGATSQTYTLTGNDIGRSIRVQVTGTGDYYGSSTSSSVGPITGQIYIKLDYQHNHRVKIESSYDNDMITNTNAVDLRSRSNSWTDFGGSKLQVRIPQSSGWDDDIARITLTPNASQDTITISGRKKSGSVPSTTITIQVRDGRYPNYVPSKSFTVVVSGSSGSGDLTIGTITTPD